MAEIFANEERFWGKTDSETIQNAVDFAEKTGAGRVIIPAENTRTGETVWTIGETILLPDCMTVVVDDAHLRLMDNVRANIFRNRDCETEKARTMAGEQHDIRIIGRGRALLDGGNPNGDCEQNLRDHPGQFPPMTVNFLIFLHNVRDFEIAGLQFIDSRYWAVSCYYCRFGRIADLDFKMYATLENQDGVDLRVGCEYITIENITGITGDDTVALTALLGNARHFSVEGKEPHIHDITIRNIIASVHGCNIIRFLCADGIQEYNITVDGVKDTGLTVGGAAILFGSYVASVHKFWRERPRAMGEFRNVVIRNVSSYAQKILNFFEPVQDLFIENIYGHRGTEVGLMFSDDFACDNMTVENVVFEGGDEKSDCVFSVSPKALENMRDYTIRRVRARGAVKHIFRRAELPVEDFTYDEPTEGYFTEEAPQLASAYGRYFRIAWGKEIVNRPKDNRYTSQTKEGK